MIKLFLTPSQLATEKSENPFAECGIGAGIFPNNETAAIISNIIWDLGTTALTSGFSSPSTCSGLKAKTAMFIYDIYDLIVEDTAKGSGEHLTTMLNLAGCEVTTHTALVGDLRGGFFELIREGSYTSQDSVTKSKNFYNMLVSKSAGICSLS